MNQEFVEVKKVGEIRDESWVFGLGFGCKLVSFTEIGSKGERRVVFIIRTSAVNIIKSDLAYIT